MDGDGFRNVLLLIIAGVYLIIKSGLKKKTNSGNSQAPAPINRPSGAPVPVTPPVPFDQAAPVMPTGTYVPSFQAPYQPPLFEELAGTKTESAITDPEMPLVHVPDSPIGKETPINPLPPVRVLPSFSGSSLVQAFVLKEIFNRPRSAGRRSPAQRR